MTAQQQLVELLATSAQASKGPWRWSENGNLVEASYDGTDETQEIAAVYTERDDDAEPLNATMIRQAVNFIRDHGPAIAELIEAARKSLPHLPVDETCCGFPVGGYMDNNYCEPPSCCGNPVFPHAEMSAALRKLTQDA